MRDAVFCPLPKGRVADPNDYEKEFNGMVSGIKVDPQTGEMKVGWQILTPPFDWDLGSTGKGPSSGWAFWTSYNTEMAHDTLEVNSSQKDRDLAAVVNWRAADKAVSEGKAEMMDGVPIIDPAKVPGVLYFVPIGKSPHGMDVDPDREMDRGRRKTSARDDCFEFREDTRGDCQEGLCSWRRCSRRAGP